VRTLTASGNTLYLAGDYDQANVVLTQAVEIARRKLPPSDILRSEALDDLANVRSQMDKDTEAVALAQEALAADRRRGPEHADTLAQTLDTLGDAYFYGGNLAAAETTMREALALHLQVSGVRGALTAQAMNNLAAVLYQLGRYDENIALMKQVVPLDIGIYGPEHPEVAVALGNLGRSTLMSGHVEEAVPYLRQALAMNEKLKGPTHDDLVPPLNSLAMIDGYLGHMDTADAQIRRAEQIARLPNHGGLLDQVLLNEADIAIQEGDMNRSAAALSESRQLLESQFPLAEHPAEAWRYAIWETVNAEMLARQGDASTARAKVGAALPVITARFGPNGFHTLLARRRGKLVDEQGAHGGAKQ
jgi:tetratricopeptide (TPR) repeat protein